MARPVMRCPVKARSISSTQSGPRSKIPEPIQIRPRYSALQHFRSIVQSCWIAAWPNRFTEVEGKTVVTIYLVSLLVPLGALWFGYPAAMEWIIGHWSSEEYSHAFMIPLVGAYMTLLRQPARGDSHSGSQYCVVALLSL